MVEVAVKQPKQDGSDSNAKIKLLQEAAILGQFKHPRVTKVYGIVMQSDPVRKTGTCTFYIYMGTELCLKNARTVHNYKFSYTCATLYVGHDDHGVPTQW